MLVFAGCAGPASVSDIFTGPVTAGTMAEPANSEASGLAASPRTDGLIWAHNDSDGEPVLFALGTDGSLRGKVRLAGVTNIDWEDLAAALIDGRPMLFVGDTGDNFAQRPQRTIHVVAEPDPASLVPDRELMLRPDYSIHFVYEDGARDIEGIAVDSRDKAVYLLSKREPQPRLYRLPMIAATPALPAVARRVGLVPHLPQPTVLDRMIEGPLHAYRGQPTAMDFSPDGTLALVLTYGDILLFPRLAGEPWAEALARKPRKLAPHGLPQAEGTCFARDGRVILVCSEKNRDLLRYERP